MQPVAQSAAKDYAPASPEATRAAAAFITTHNEWATLMREAEVNLRAFVRENFGEPRGFLSRDRMNMSVFGIVFDKPPASGFVAVPSPIAEDLRTQGLRGEAYFPDTNHAKGRQVLSLMTQLSRAAEQRPLLVGVPGVDSYTLEGTRVVLTRAVQGSDGSLVIRAGQSAGSPEAEVTPVQIRREAVATVDAEAAARAARTNTMRR